jgi:thioredoxin 1
LIRFFIPFADILERENYNTMTQSVSDESFSKEVENHKGLVVIDFWAEWCGPCKQIAQTIDEIAEDLKGDVKVMKMNIDESSETPSKLGIRSIPTLMLFKDGKHIDTKVGSSPKNILIDWIKSHK